MAKTLAIKSQLRLSDRFLRNEFTVNETFHVNRFDNISFEDIPEYDSLKQFIPKELVSNAHEVQSLTFKEKSIEKTSVLHIAGDEDHNMFIVKHIILTSDTNLLLIVNDITEYALYVNHYYAFKLDSEAFDDRTDLKVLSSYELKSFVVTHVLTNGNGEKFIVERWI